MSSGCAVPALVLHKHFDELGQHILMSGQHDTSSPSIVSTTSHYVVLLYHSHGIRVYWMNLDIISTTA